MTPSEEIKNMLIPILSSMRAHGSTEAEIIAYRNGFTTGAMWRQTHPHWISVDDELPKINPNDSEWENSDDVLVAFKDGSIAVGRYERDISTGKRYWILYGVGKDLVVTHWMPLPSVEHLKKGDKK